MLKNLPNCSLILTTHRMDEAESLCDKITIMINGRFVVLGSPGHLKTHYGEGYNIKFKTDPQNVQVLHQFVTQNLPYLYYKDTVLLDEQLNGHRV